MAYHSAQIYLAVQSLFPNLVNMVDYTLSDFGQGPVIGRWMNATVPQPTQAQLEAVDTDALLAASLIPQAVSQKQARLALLGAGLLDQVNAAITAVGGASLITWEYSDTISRNDPLTLTLGAALGLTASQIDALFVTAAAL